MVGSTNVRLCIKFPQNNMAGEQHMFIPITSNFCVVFAAHLVCFLCCVLFVLLFPCTWVLLGFRWVRVAHLISFLCYVLFVFVLCLVCGHLWIVHSWLPLRFSLTFINLSRLNCYQEGLYSYIDLVIQILFQTYQRLEEYIRQTWDTTFPIVLAIVVVSL